MGYRSVATQDNSFSVGSFTNERRITNVSPGINGTDVANFGQLRSLRGEVYALHERTMVGIAIANAMQTVVPSSGKTFSIRIGAGVYRDANAIGISASGRINDRVYVDVGVSFATSLTKEYGGKVGVTFEW